MGFPEQVVELASYSESSGVPVRDSASMSDEGKYVMSISGAHMLTLMIPPPYHHHPKTKQNKKSVTD